MIAPRGPVRSDDDAFVWWLDGDDLRALVEKRPDDGLDLLERLNVPHYLASVVRASSDRPADDSNSGAADDLRGGFTPQALAALGADRCIGLPLSGCDLDCVHDLPGFVTDRSLRVVTPRPRGRRHVTELRIAAFIRRGCRCGRPVDLIYNQPVVIDHRSDTLGLRLALDIFCEACYSDRHVAGD